MAFVALLMSCLVPIVNHFDSTVYSEGYSEDHFRRIRVGMTANEVLSLMGEPIQVVPPNQWQSYETWKYTDQRDYTANFNRRWVFMDRGKVVQVVNDYWID